MEHLLVRNSILLAAIGSALLFSLPRPTLAEAVPNRPGRSKSRPGFTLVETLICIMIVAIVVSLTAPHLHDARTAARRSVSLANLRMHGAIFAIYGGDFKDTFPCYTDRTSEWSDVAAEALGIGRRIKYFWGSGMWNIALADRYYDGDPFLRCFYPPTFPYGVDMPVGESRGSTPYQYACVFIAAPEYWNPDTRTGPSQWSATRFDQVLFPSDKSLLTNTFIAPLPRDSSEAPLPPKPTTVWEFACVDGSTRTLLNNAAVRGYLRGDGPWTEPVHPGDLEPGTHTLDGVRGRDFR